MQSSCDAVIWVVLLPQATPQASMASTPLSGQPYGSPPPSRGPGFDVYTLQPPPSRGPGLDVYTLQPPSLSAGDEPEDMLAKACPHCGTLV